MSCDLFTDGVRSPSRASLSLLTAFMMGQGCPNASTLSSLANSVLSSSGRTRGGVNTTQAGEWGRSGWNEGGVGGLLAETFTSAPFTATFTPSQTGQPVDVVVAGNNPGSRLNFTVTDPSGAAVASVTSPTPTSHLQVSPRRRWASLRFRPLKVAPLPRFILFMRLSLPKGRPNRVGTSTAMASS